MKLYRPWACFIGVILLVIGIGVGGRGGVRVNAADTRPPGALRVGVAPFYPPLIFKEQGTMKGLEADFAAQIGQELGRSIQFVELPLEQLIPALEAEHIDVIMSGMSITEARQKRVHFVAPYLQVGQMAMVRKDALLEAGSPSLLARTRARVGFVQGSTGAAYVQANLLSAEKVPLPSAEAGIEALRAGTIQVFIHDAPTAWQVAGNKRDEGIVASFWPLTKEYLAWAVRPSDASLYTALQDVMRKWKRTQRLQTLISQWLTVRIDLNQ